MRNWRRRPVQTALWSVLFFLPLITAYLVTKRVPEFVIGVLCIAGTALLVGAYGMLRKAGDEYMLALGFGAEVAFGTVLALLIN